MGVIGLEFTLYRNDVPSVRAICRQLVTSCLHLGRFFLLPPTHTLVTLGKIDAHFQKKAQIKQRTTSKVNCILFNRLLNPVLLNKSSLVRAKASNFNLKSLNRYFSNYYQVQIWPVFAETITNIYAINTAYMLYILYSIYKALN